MLYAPLASLCILAQVAPPSNSIDERIDRSASEEMVGQPIPGAAVAVIKNEVTLRAEGSPRQHRALCARAKRERFSIRIAGETIYGGRDHGIGGARQARSGRSDSPPPSLSRAMGIDHGAALATHTSGLPDDELVLNLRRDYTANSRCSLHRLRAVIGQVNTFSPQSRLCTPWHDHSACLRTNLW